MERVAGLIAGLVTRVPDPGAHAIGVWSVAETAAHLSHSGTYFLDAARGEADPLEDLAENATSMVRAVAADPERRLDVLADRIMAGEGALVAYARSVSGDPLVRPFVDVDVRLSAMLAVELAELLVHGWDIARRSERGWEIRPSDAVMALAGVFSLLPYLVDQDRASHLVGSCEVRIRGGYRVVMHMDHGRVYLTLPEGVRPDSRLSVDPVAFLLLAYGRIGQLQQALRGRVVPSGRRPWPGPQLLPTVHRV